MEMSRKRYGDQVLASLGGHVWGKADMMIARDCGVRHVALDAFVLNVLTPMIATGEIKFRGGLWYLADKDGA